MQRVFTVNMGSSRVGLSTVGYTLKFDTGQIFKARTTAGVAEFGTSSGVYGVDLSLPDDFVGSIQWDSGEATPAYAVEDITLGKTEYKVTDEVRTLLRAHLNQLIEFINKKFKDYDARDNGVKELASEFAEMKSRLEEHLSDDEKTDEVWEEDYLQPILDKVEALNKEISEKHDELVKYANSKASEQKIVGEMKLSVNGIETKLEQMTSQMTEVQKDIAFLSGDAQKLIDSMKNDIKSVIENVKNDVADVPNHVKVPNYEQNLAQIERKMAENLTHLEELTQNGAKSLHGGVADASRDLKKAINDLKVVIGEEGRRLVDGFENRFSQGMEKLTEMLYELHPETLEKRKLEKQKMINKMNFIAGVRHG